MGAPTVVLDLPSAGASAGAGGATAGCAVPYGEVVSGYMSQPVIGKHLVFDGRCLHGAPAAGVARPTEAAGARRVTFLANIWIGYHPMDLQRLPARAVTARNLRPVDFVPIGDVTGTPIPASTWTATPHSVVQSFLFGPDGDDHRLTLPLPAPRDLLPSSSSSSSRQASVPLPRLPACDGAWHLEFGGTASVTAGRVAAPPIKRKRARAVASKQ